MSQIKLKHALGNGVSITAPSSNPAADRTLELPGDADGIIAKTDTSGNLNFADSKRINLGDSSDLRIYHDGSNSYIQDAGTGDLILKGSTNLDITSAGNELKARFTTNGSAELYFDNSKKIETLTNGALVTGNLGIGDSSPTKPLTVGTTTPSILLDDQSGRLVELIGGSSSTGPELRTAYAEDLRFGTNSTERMRLDSAGALNINTSVNPLTGNSAGRVHITCPNGGDGINIKHLHSGHCINIWRANGDGNLVNFYRGNSSQGSTVGGISVTSSNTSFNTSSDYRLKENATAISDGITRLKTLKPYRFNFKIDPSKTVDGFFAHEVTAVPEAVTGSKDETQNILYTEDDTIPSGKKIGDVKEVQPVYQGIDQSKLVPLLTAALQEAIAKIEVLETKVAALEAS